MSWFSRCSWCGGPFNGGNYRRCTNVSFEDEFVCNLDPISNDETPNFSYPPSQPQTSSFDQFHCFHCGDPLEDGVRGQQCTCVRCGYYEKDFVHFAILKLEIHSFMIQIQILSMILQMFSPTLHNPSTNHTHYSINHQEDLNQQWISDVHVRWDKIEESQNELLNMMQSFWEMVIQQRQAVNIDQSPPQEISIQEMKDLKQQYLNGMQSISNQIQIKDYCNEKIDIRYRRECEIMIDELTGKFNGMSIEINKKKELRKLEQSANFSTYTTEPSWRFNSFYNDDDYEASIIPLTSGPTCSYLS
ncbi:hypothetical protein Tco_0281326 [Tanacetum coccineum]